MVELAERGLSWTGLASYVQGRVEGVSHAELVEVKQRWLALDAYLAVRARGASHDEVLEACAAGVGLDEQRRVWVGRLRKMPAVP